MKKILLPCLMLCTAIVNAQSHYPGQHQGKFAIADQLKPALYSFDLSDVKILDSRFKQNMEREQLWLLSIDGKKLLHSFRTTAGVYSGLEGGYDLGQRLAGWESLDCELRGHSTGHILSGLALLYASTGNKMYKVKADSLVDGLAAVQKAFNQDGYLGAFPQELINRNIAGQRVWAPWYTLHKILAGLIDQYLYSDNSQALQIASGVASWAYKKLQNLSQDQRKIMLRNEFGGINESFYNLYAITGNTECKWLGDFFYHDEALDPLKEGKDILEKKHANTYIPKLLGLTRKYELDGAGTGDSVAGFFWNTVIAHHSFATGSNSDKESFFKPDEISQHLSGYTGESCNIYNMLKLTKHLYTHSGDMKYADYYEKALLNHILGQQDPATGMIAYFLPMLPGAHKVYSTRDSSFWCCVGTGFENQAKYGESIYYHTQNDLFINLFIPSKVQWREKGFALKQETRFPVDGMIRLTVQSSNDAKMAFNIRYPSWAIAGVSVKVNDKKIPVSQRSGSYIVLNRIWKNGDTIDIDFPMTLSLIPANDNPNIAAIAYGPVILAGEMGTEGLMPPAPYSNPRIHNDYYSYDYNVPQGIVSTLQLNKKKLSDSILPVAGNALTFKTVKEGITLRPVYDIHRERYVVYWNLQ